MKYSLLILLSFGFFALTGCPDKGGDNNNGFNNQFQQCEQFRANPQAYNSCIQSLSNFNNQGGLNSYSWQGTIRVTNSSSYKDLLFQAQVCDTSPLLNWGSGRCSKWNDQVLVTISSQSLNAGTNGVVRVLPMSTWKWSPSISTRALVSSNGVLKTSGNDIAIFTNNRHLRIKHANLIEGSMNVELWFNGEVLASGQVHQSQSFQQQGYGNPYGGNPYGGYPNNGYGGYPNNGYNNGYNTGYGNPYGGYPNNNGYYPY